MGRLDPCQQRRVPFGTTLPPSLLERIDRARGMIPRTKFLEVLIEKGLLEHEKTQPGRRT